MAFTKYQMLLSVVMVATGSINTLSTKWANRLKARGADDQSEREFDHPFVQACFMFMGEILCLLAFKFLVVFYDRRQAFAEDVPVISGNRNFNPLILFPAAMFDMVATSLMYVGLVLTTASSFQMLRGSVIVFVALLSTSFIRDRRIEKHQWTGIAFVIVGLVVVGLSDYSEKVVGRDSNSLITGDLLVIMAQIITACQMVYEEKYVVDKDIPPLQAVGWEGTFGLLVLGFLLFPFYYIRVGPPFAKNPRAALEDFPDAVAQIIHNPVIGFALVGTMISIAFFNFAGISMTKELSATTRMVLDSVRTFFIWMFCLLLQWQDFHYLQLLGFAILLVGMIFYYQLIPFGSVFARIENARSEDEEIISQPADQP